MSNKPVYEIYNTSLHHCEEKWPNDPSVKGMFFARGFTNRGTVGNEEMNSLRTSPILNIDLATGEIETQNTIYKMVMVCGE